MARKKVNLAWIANDSTRRATCKKRKKGLMKKVSELATLCNVKACMIIYGPQEQQPEVWPSAQEAARLLERFKSMPEMEKCRKMMDQEGFLRQRAAKLQEQLRRQERDNRELEVSLLMHQAVAGRSLYDVNIEDATSLAWMVDAKLKSVQDRINQQTTQLALRSAAESSATSQVTAKDPIEMAMDSLQRQNWLLDATHPSENVIFGGGGGEEIMPISCVEHNSSWLDLYFPFN